MHISEFPRKYGILDLSLSEASEIIVAQILKGRVAPARNPSYDVYKSEMFPGLTFQVKIARDRIHPSEEKNVGGRDMSIIEHHTWTWNDPSKVKADWYVLFGIRDKIVYPFVMHRLTWLDHSTEYIGGRILKVTAQEFSRCGRYTCSYKENRHWDCYIRDWPKGLFGTLEHGRPPRQLSLFDQSEEWRQTLVM